MTDSSARIRIAFVCVQNAGRSQMASAFAHRAVASRGVSDRIEILTGGTRPAEHIHETVVRSMRAVGIDIAGQTPREITFEEIQASDYVITMGCAADDVCPAGWAGENRDWDLDDPDGKSIGEVDRIRDKIDRRVSDLFDELEST
ncbi:MAG: low molecular weight phosphatase family protein [Halobacteriota archaeon]